MERPGAILRLRVSAVYGKGGPLPVIVIPRLTRKDRKTREVPVCPQLRQELKAFKPPSHGWLFPSPYRGDRPLTLRSWDLALRQKFAEFGMQGYSSYSLRRGAITHLARAGKGIREIQDCVGHASVGTTQRYIEVSPEDRLTVLEML